MQPINVLVLATTPDIKAEVIAKAVAEQADMNLVGERVLTPAEGDALLKAISCIEMRVMVLVGPSIDTEESAKRWLAERTNVVVISSTISNDVVRIELHDPSLDSLLNFLRTFNECALRKPQEHVSYMGQRGGALRPESEVAQISESLLDKRPLLRMAIDWAHNLLRNAVERTPDGNGDLYGLSVTRATLLQWLDLPSKREFGIAQRNLADADTRLGQALTAADIQDEPLAVIVHALGLEPLEVRMLLLALAPEIDPRYQRCAGFLLDEMGRRVGTISLYASLLGTAAEVRCAITNAGSLARWRIFDMGTGYLLAADEPLRLDPYLTDWLLGDRFALGNDPQVRRATRSVQWPGACLLRREEERVRALNLMKKLQHSSETQWVLLGGNDPAGWRALLELGAEALQTDVVRVELQRFTETDILEIEECALRLSRIMRLTGCPLIIDATGVNETTQIDNSVERFLATISSAGCTAAVICPDSARIVRLIGTASCEFLNDPALPGLARFMAVRAAAGEADAQITDEMAEAIANRYPLYIDGIENAMRLACSRPLRVNTEEPEIERFIGACKEIAAEGVSHLAERLEPVFMLHDIVLPPDRRQQLYEIVDSIRLASRVLDQWRFGEQLPYGRGVTVLFHGPSGTGKTMAALGVARQLGVQILRLDLSRVVSKYIGDTEKNIDRIFCDAQKSGTAILMDEAEALFGKRSEVKDSHDRYANIEVAYLLQRMEAFDGLAILTTNLRQNLDPAFLRRLRFIVEFPRPDIEAREQIWRRCLPDESHMLDDAAFRQLARRIDLTGGNIRQITLRAAFIAAAAGTLIDLKHIAMAARGEFAKLGMPPVEIDFIEKRNAA